MPKFIKFANHGRVGIGINLIDNAIHLLSIGGKNCFFVDSQKSDEIICHYYTIFGK